MIATPRPIEFRAWHIPTQRMHYGVWFNTEHVFIPWDSSKTDAENYPVVNHPLSLIDCILMQFTGMFDEYGTKVFEGDIQRFDHAPDRGHIPAPDEDESDWYYSSYYQVRFINGGFCSVGVGVDDPGNWDTFSFDQSNALDPVIGNAYEHPELTRLTGEHPLAISIYINA